MSKKKDSGEAGLDVDDGRDVKRARQDGEHEHDHTGADEQQFATASAPAGVDSQDQQAAIDAAAAVAAAGALAAAGAAPDGGVDAESAAAAAAAAAQLAQLNADQAQHAMQQSLDVQAQLAAAVQNLDPAQAAAALAAQGVQGVPVSAAQLQALNDPATMAALHQLNLTNLASMQGVLDHNGQPLHVMSDGLQLQAHGVEAYAAAMAAGAHHQGAQDEAMAEMQRQHLEATRKSDYQALAAAKRTGQLATITFTLDLPPELADIELTDRAGIVEVPAGGDVMMLKRLFQYQAHNKLLPALQTLLTEHGEEMADAKDDGSPVPLTHYNVVNGSSIVLKITIPDELDNVPMVDEALASAAYTSASGGARTPSRKTRWTTEQIEALIEGVEKYGLSAWRTIVMDPRLASKNNMQCKDKFRNLCLTIIQGRPERGLTLPWQLKDRVRALIEQENIKGAGAFAGMGGMSE